MKITKNCSLFLIIFALCFNIFPASVQFETEGLNTGDLCDAYSSSELTNGQAIAISGDKGSWKHFFINVPSGTTNLSMKISGGSGDADLYTRFGSQPTTSSYDCRPYKDGNNEECTVANPQAGKYYVTIHGYSAYSASLVASFDSGSGPEPGEEQELTNGQNKTISGTKDSWTHFFINVPSGATNLSMKISGGSGDADMYTRFGSQPTTSSYDCRPYQDGNNEECTVANPQAGKYYVAIHGWAAYSVGLVASIGSADPGPLTFICTKVDDQTTVIGSFYQRNNPSQ